MHTDALGSPVAYTSSTGSVLAGRRTQYEPYGTPTTTPRNGEPSYTGHQYDQTTGLIYAQARFYDPTLGRFLSTDPMAVDTTSAFNFNRYAYANNSPYKFTDPDGRAAIPAAGVGCAVTGPGCPVGATVGFIVGKIATAVAVVAVLDWATTPESQAADSAGEGSAATAGGTATPPPDDGDRSREKTAHGQERADQARYDPNRSVGDSNKVVRDGQRFLDNDTGNTVHVNGNRVVVTNEKGDVVTQFKNSRANTISRVESGRWTKIE